MAIKADISESNPDGGGNFFTEACKCHFIVMGWEDHSGVANPYVEVEMQALASDVPSQVGKKRQERFYLGAKSIGKLLEWACAVGIYNKPQWAADKAAGVSPGIEVEDAVGRQFAAPVAMNLFDIAYCNKQIEKYTKANDHINLAKEVEKKAKNEGKPFPQIGGTSGFTYWALGDEEADKVPLDRESVAQFGNVFLTKQGTKRQRGSGPTPPAAGMPAPVTPPSTPPVNTASSFL